MRDSKIHRLLGPQSGEQLLEREHQEHKHSAFGDFVELVTSHKPDSCVGMPFANDHRSELEQKYDPPDAAYRQRWKNITDYETETNESPIPRRELPQLPEDVVVRIMMHASVEDIGNSRLTCRMWRDAIDGHELELWRGRCDAFDLFPPIETNTGMGIATEYFRLLVAKIHRDAPAQDMRRELIRAYRRHYWEWAPTCYRRVSESRPIMQVCCADPNNLPWNITRERWLMAHYCRYVMARFSMLTNMSSEKRKRQATMAEHISRSWAAWAGGKIPNYILLEIVARMFQEAYPFVDIVDEYRWSFHRQQVQLNK